MLRPTALFVALVVAAAGCGDAPRETSPVTAESEKETAADMAEAEGTDEKSGDEPAGIETPEPAEEVAAEEMPSEEVAAAEPAESAESSLLELEGIRFVVPGGWNKVKPQNNIVEAEFELPHLPGDEFDGRLTLMSSGGDPQDVIANRTAEFIREPGSGLTVEPMMIGRIEATWVDLQGEWKGPAFKPVDPRPDYRMLLVIIPFTERSAFYAKLTGPRETVTAREEEFRAFVQSAQITMPQREPIGDR